MSVHTFNAKQGPILVEVEAVGPAGNVNLTLVLDTGATMGVIILATLLYLGFDPDQSPQRVRMTTGSTVEVVPIVVLTRLSALGQHRFGLPVIAHALPASSSVNGLLGLDFLNLVFALTALRPGCGSFARRLDPRRLAWAIPCF